MYLNVLISTEMDLFKFSEYFLIPIYMDQVMELRLSCYLVLPSLDS